VSGWIYLVVAVVSLGFTLNALHPVRRSWLLVVPGFVASWMVGELAAHHLFWQAVIAGVFVASGALDSWPGWVALALTAVNMAALGVLVVQSAAAGPVVEAALANALGPRYRDEIAPDLSARLDEGFTWRQRLLPLPVRDRRVERIRNVRFVQAGGRDLTLDVYRAKDHEAFPGPRPTLLQVHGGAWIMGRKDDQGLPLMLRLAAHGWVCVSADYRLSPTATFPEHEIDVKAAIRWIRDEGVAHGCDPDFIAVTGGSAGGHLSALAALTGNDPEYQPDFPDADTTVQAALPFYGVYDFTDRKGHWEGSRLVPMLERYVMKASRVDDADAFERASPMTRVRADAPPFFVVHGTRDTLVPVDDARTFVELLQAVSEQPVAYAELPGAQHAFEIFPSVRTGHAIRGAERFLCWVLTRHRAARPATAGE